MVIPTIGTVGGGGGAAVSDGTEVAFTGAGRVGASVLHFLVVECADRTDWVGILADWWGMAVPLTVSAAGGFIGRVSDLDFPLAGEEEDV